MNKRELTYPSSNQEQQIRAYVYFPDTNEHRAIIQISHGMSEHITRYMEFIRFLTDNGFIVCGNDHAGHGASACGHFGYMGARGGHDHMVNDVHTLYTKMRAQLPAFPYILLGHSMGSFVVRDYMTKWGEGLSGVILSGTGYASFPRNIAYLYGLLHSKIMVAIKGPYVPAKAFQQVTQHTFKKRFSPFETTADWQTRDREKAMAFINDPECGFTFTYPGYSDIMKLLLRVSRKDWAKGIPRDLPIFLLSGDNDPVGNYGKDVLKTYHRMKTAGVQNVELILYPGGRHEMLNEINRQSVYEDILKWIEHVIQ